jgi:hypothetical protein
LWDNPSALPLSARELSKPRREASAIHERGHKGFRPTNKEQIDTSGKQTHIHLANCLIQRYLLIVLRVGAPFQGER